MACAEDILEGWDRPAAVIDAGGALVAANVLFHGANAPLEQLAALRPTERFEMADLGGGRWVWRAVALSGDERLLVAEASAVEGLDARERYLAALSHELRTPLNGVLGMAGLLAGTRLDSDQKAYVQALRESGLHLLNLVNDVLDLAKLESGQIDLETAPVDVEYLLQSVSELLSPRAREKGLEIAWCASSPRLQVLADEGRLRQILFNLAGNAVKFTETGGVLIQASLTQGPGESPAELRLSVKDTGPGVAEADRARIFDEYARAPGAGARLEGAGLGLAIVRRLAAAHDGSVGLTAPPEGGSEFWFQAPFPGFGGSGEGAELEGLTILILSPSPVVRASAQRQVEACGGQAIVAADLAGLESETFDAALVDRALLQGGGLPRLTACAPAIVLLSPEERAEIPSFRAQGFAGYLIKPLRRASLAQRVLAVAGSVRQQAAPPPVEDDRIIPACAVGLRVLLAEDNPINAILARALLEREGCTVETAVNGLETVSTVERGDHDLILMDVRMPGMDGLQAARVLRQRGLRRPIIALTADAFEDDRRACLAAGMDDFLTKPLELSALRAILTRWGAPAWTQEPVKDKLAS